jgi:hypothetical protein
VLSYENEGKVYVYAEIHYDGVLQISEYEK